MRWLGKTLADYKEIDRMRMVVVTRNINLLMDYDSVLIMAPNDNALRSI